MDPEPRAGLPDRPPFVLRGSLVTPLGAGGTRFEPDAAVAVDERGRIAYAGPASAMPVAHVALPLVDVRPLVIMPGLVDLHVHLPQLPNAGLGSGLHLLDWLQRYIYPLERAFDADVARTLAPLAFAELASLGTTTVVMYGAAWMDSVDEAFIAAERCGIRAVIGRVMMDRFSYRDEAPDRRLEVELDESAELCSRWHGRDDGRLSYAFTPRFAVSCTPELLRRSARLADDAGAYWQTHLSEDRSELAEVARLFPSARDYVDIYDAAGALGPRAILAHAIHLSDREIDRVASSGSRVAHCPESNLFLGSGAMPLDRYRAAGIVVGLGSDVAGGPSLSLFSAMRSGAYVHELLFADVECGARPTLGPLDWLRLGTFEGARALGIEDRVGSLEPGKEADLILVDVRLTAPLPGDDPSGDAIGSDEEELVGRLIFRSHPEMVRGAWVRGRRLASRDDVVERARGSSGARVAPIAPIAARAARSR